MIRRNIVIMLVCLCHLLAWANPIKELPTNQPIGVCLSGGGALGFVHIGALQALEDNGIKPHIISGCSMGSLIGAMYANGYSPQEIMDIIKEHKLYKTSHLISVRKSKRGITGLWGIIKLIEKELIPHNSFDSLSIPFYTCVTNLSTGKAAYIHQGNELAKYVCASASVPGIFESIKIDTCYYTDGGIVDNLPITPLQEQHAFIIAIDALQYPKTPTIKNTTDVLLLSVLLMNSATAQPQIQACDWYIPCRGADHYDALSFESYKELYQIGYDAVQAYIRQQ